MPCKLLTTIYRAFLKPLIDCGIICELTQYESFCEKLESMQNKATLAITGAMQGSSREKRVLGLEMLKSRRWHKRLSCMFKVIQEKALN